MGNVRILIAGAISTLVVSFGGLALAESASAAVNLGDDKTYGVGDKPYSLAAADFDKDGAADLVVPNQLSNDVSVLLGKGDGTFSAPANYRAGAAPRTVATADFDGNATVDLAVANKDSNDVSILLGNGDGTFAAPRNFGSGGDGPRTITSADLNGDGAPDLVVANRFSDNVGVLLGNGDGTFDGAVTYAAGDRAYEVTSADFDGNGRLDLVVTNPDSDDVSVLLGRGDGTFGRTAYYGVGDSPYTVAAADFDEDGIVDLAVGNLKSRNVSIMDGRGDGTFAAPRNYGQGIYYFALTAADLDGDGKLDLAVASHPYQGNNTYAGSFATLRGNGDGTFAAPASYGAGLGPVAVVASDFDGDARPDLAVTNRESDDVSVLIQGDTSLGLTADRTLLTYTEGTTLAGRLLDAAGNPLGGKKVVLEGRPWAGDPAKLPFQPVAGQPEGGVVTASDGTFSLPGVKPRWTTDYRARFAGDGTNEPVTSPVEVVELKVKIALNVSSANLRLGESRTISGTVFPGHHDMPVTLTIERNGVPVATRRTPTDAASRFSTSYKPTRTGAYSVIARFPDHFPGHLGNVSPVRRFEVVE